MDINQLSVDALRVLSLQEIEKANSGHPGICLGAAPIVYTLFSEIMNYNPENPEFFDRDRFVLSAGHGSALYYAALHTFGFGVTKEDLANFRQLGSKTPGHPEYGITKGVEVSTGPLGQGIANAVGMALAESMLAAKYNREGFPVVDHYTYALCGDGCLQEGIEYEAASFAGTNKLGKLIVLYDKNDITIEGNIKTSFSEDVGKRHEALGWQVITVEDGNSISDIKEAVLKAKKQTDKPSLIIIKTHIGYGSPLQDSEGCHGSPIKGDNLKATIEKLGMGDMLPFTLPQAVKENAKKIIQNKIKSQKAYDEMYKAYAEKYPDLSKELSDRLSGKIPQLDGYEKAFVTEKADATRNSGHAALNEIAKLMPSLTGGAADLAPSTKAFIKGEEFYSPENKTGRNIHFGIREHAMGAIANGMYLHGGMRPFASTFFVFSDYMRNAMRMSALMNIPVIYIMSHDSIGVGEDGPTHEPIEHLSTFRAMPNINVIRPCDAKETAAAYEVAIKSQRPTLLVLSRQSLPQYEMTGKGLFKGGYTLIDSNKSTPDGILIATGSEVEVAVKARQMLMEKGVDVRVVSMPCMELFDEQSAEYKESVLPSAVTARVSVEAGSTMSWYKYVGLKGYAVGIDSFGRSGKAEDLFTHFGITAENVADKMLKILK